MRHRLHRKAGGAEDAVLASGPRRRGCGSVLRKSAADDRRGDFRLLDRHPEHRRTFEKALQLRIKRLLHLRGDERHRDEDERCDGDPFSRRDDAPAPARGHHALERERHEQDQPDVTRRAGFVIRETEREKRERCRGNSPKSKNREREDEQEKKIEQRPRGEPIAAHPIRAEQREEPPAGRELERDVHRVRIRAPAGGGKFLRAIHASGRLEIDRPRADFHARRGGLRIARDQLPLPAVAHRAEILAGRRIEPPDLLHLPGDGVAKREPAPIFIEPQFTIDREPGRFLLAHSAHAFLDAERRGRVPAIDRKVAPFFGKCRLRDIDRRRADDLDDAEIRPGAEGDELLRGRGFSRRRMADFLRIIEAKRIGADRPLARAHLRFHAPRVVHRDRDRALDRREFPAFGKDGADLLLAARARDGQLDLGAQPERDAILERGISSDRQKILVRFFDRAVAPEPEDALRVPHRRVHGLAIDGEREDADLARQRKALREVVPAIRAGDAPGARAQAQRGIAIVLDHGERLVVRSHFDRPHVLAAGQRDPRFVENGDVEIESRAGVLDREREARRPKADALLRIVKRVRAIAIIVIPRRPADPRFERIGNRLRAVAALARSVCEQLKRERHSEDRESENFRPDVLHGGCGGRRCD